MSEAIEISEGQKRIMNAVASWRGPGVPSAQKLADDLGYSGESTVRMAMRPLEQQGLIERFSMGPGLPKIPRLTKAGLKLIGVETIPLKGRAHGGPNGCQFEEDSEGLTFAQVFPLRGGEYFLLAAGDCMAGGPHPIYPDDLALVRPCNRVIRPKNGSIVHVEIEDEKRCENDILFREYSYREEWDDKLQVLRGIVSLTHYYPKKVTVEYPDEQVDPRGVVVRIISDPEMGRGK